MEKQLEIILATHNSFIKLMDGLTEEQLNKIPYGFNNNIIWNFAHCTAAYQVLCYTRNELAITIDETFFKKYANGTIPETHVSKALYEEYKKIWLDTTSIYNLPIIYNLYFGHAVPRCILPYGGKVKIDFDQAKIVLQEPLVN